MAESKVQCACGREMKLDALRGKGAYRCGCGASVKVQFVEAATGMICSVAGCSTVASRTITLVCVCTKHEKQLALELAPKVYLTYPPGSWRQMDRDYQEQFGSTEHSKAWLDAAKRFEYPETPRDSRTHPPKVYFLVVNGRVKIGTTTCLTNRLSSLSLPPDARVALTVDGSYDLESKLHQRFRDERLGRSEWFTLSPRIEAFIAERKTSRRTATSPSKPS